MDKNSLESTCDYCDYYINDLTDTPGELRASYIEPADDLYGELINAVAWRSGGSSK